MRRVAETNEALVSALVSALQRSSSASRARAALLLERVTAAMPPSRLVSLAEQVFREAVELLRDRSAVSRPATKAALHVLVRTAAWGRNRVKAVDAGAVPVLVDNGAERRSCELVLAALDRLCGCVVA